MHDIKKKREIVKCLIRYIDFVFSKELWGDTPTKFNKFSDLLLTKIKFLQTIYS